MPSTCKKVKRHLRAVSFPMVGTMVHTQVLKYKNLENQKGTDDYTMNRTRGTKLLRTLGVPSSHAPPTFPHTPTLWLEEAALHRGTPMFGAEQGAHLFIGAVRRNLQEPAWLSSKKAELRAAGACAGVML